MKKIITLLACLTISGCSLYHSTSEAFKVEEIKPWERNILARDDMQLNPDPVRTFSDEHIYFSKEAATGGRGVGGGGCGCN